MSFLTELKRRNVFKVGFAYAVVAWLIMQVSSTAAPALNLPDWTTSMITFLLVLGFPITLILAWAFELTPDGVRSTQAASIEEDVTKLTSRRLDFAIIALLGAAVVFLVLDNYILEDDTTQVVETVPEPIPEETIPVPDPESATPEQPDVLPNSVAVLPFENLSLDPENAFFAAGIHDEILNQLVKLSALNVIARTSVMQYEDTLKTIPEIASELNVETVMEGSVRYADDRVLVTAQLIDPETNAHLWSDSYNREFADIFAIQADIAMNIANALQAEFSLEEQAAIERIPTESAEAYQYFLSALQESPFSAVDLRMEYLNLAIEADSGFAEAYVQRGLQRIRQLVRNTTSQEEFEALVAENERLALADIGTALEIDPGLGLAHALDAQIHEYNWRGSQALDAYEKAYELSPNDPHVLAWYATFLSRAGFHDKALTLAERRNQLDPTGGQLALANNLWRAGDLDRSAGVFRERLRMQPGNNDSRRLLANYAWLNGDLDGVKNHLAALEAQVINTPINSRIATVAAQYALYGLQEDAQRVLEIWEQKSENQRVTTIARFQEQLARGDREQALHWLGRVVEEQQPYQGTPLINTLKHNELHNPMFEEPEFVELRNQLGFTDL